jgi:uncharacterized MAPEG superfamily protein
MTIPLWVLLGFAGWTLVVLFGTIGVYRWSRILTGCARVAEWQADTRQGSEWYRRAMRAHMNCVENLPVYGAIVVCATAAGARGRFLDALALVFMSARICQTTVHLAFAQTDFVASSTLCVASSTLCILFRVGSLHGSHGNFGGGVSGSRVVGNGRNGSIALVLPCLAHVR